jgi:hypothetical protein
VKKRLSRDFDSICSNLHIVKVDGYFEAMSIHFVVLKVHALIVHANILITQLELHIFHFFVRYYQNQSCSGDLVHVILKIIQFL